MGSLGAQLQPAKTASEQLVGQDTSALRKFSASWAEGTKSLREDFNLDWATDQQIEAARRILAGVYEYDKDYDKKPYKITHVDIKPLEDLKGHMVFTIYTEPDTPSAYLRITDGKNRHVFIGKKGGISIIGSKGGEVRLTEFQAQYWPLSIRRK